MKVRLSVIEILYYLCGMNHTSEHTFLPAEWHPQSGIQLTWPHEDTDWYNTLGTVLPCYVAIAHAIAMREKLLIVCRDAEMVKAQLQHCNLDNITFCVLPINDTWARDHGAITMIENGKPVLLDFKFNGWGLKFAANHDNLITQKLHQQKVFQTEVSYRNMQHLVLEGGGIESDGKGTLLTTKECLLSPNRNGYLNENEIEDKLKNIFSLQRVLWLHHGFLEGDDTDSHIDTLARFCDAQTIVYVQCTDPSDIHFEALAAMENELKAFKTLEGKPYKLLPLPMADETRDEEGNRLPATYANFLIMNEVVLLPFYGSAKDYEAKEVLQTAFPGREIIGINCEPLIQQHGSLHCITMQYPEGVL